ncbi:MAG: hypothetical protein LAP85_03615 [Acidobacteriia bacterium]|nr:hypothetical protein [Terriglobia bacterium]
MILARRLRGAVRPMFLLDPDDRWSQAHVRHCGFDYRHFDPRRPWPAAEPAAAVLIDTRKRVGLRRLIAAARLRGIPVASIHDLGLAPVASDVVFDGSILPAKDRFPRDDTTFFTGTGYLVLADGCERFHRNDKRIRPRIRKVVVNLGGGDGRRLFGRVLRGLRSTNAKLEVVGLPGFCSWGQGELTRTRWNPVRFRWLSPQEDALRIMFDADLVISAGGLAAYEALCLGAPLCALSCDRHQASTVEALARAGACLDLGRGTLLKNSDLISRFQELNGHPDLRHQLSARGHALVDGGGTRRVARILHAMMKGRSHLMTNS